MILADWMILIAAFLPLVSVGIAKAGAPGFDNATPRAWADGLSGWRQRAEWAHRNHFETFAPFAAAVLVAQLAHAPAGWIDALAVGFVLCRIAYTAAYVGDRPTLRSAIFSLGLLCVIGLFVVAATV